MKPKEATSTVLVETSTENMPIYVGLKRTGKSCRLRWVNYLHPDLKRENLTLQEQLLILHLHSHWGNRYVYISRAMVGSKLSGSNSLSYVGFTRSSEFKPFILNYENFS